MKYRIPTFSQFIAESEIFRIKKPLVDFIVWFNEGKILGHEVTPESEAIVNWAEATMIGDSATHLEPAQAYELYTRFGNDKTMFYSEKDSDIFKIKYNIGTLEFITTAINAAFNGEPVNETDWYAIKDNQGRFLKVSDEELKKLNDYEIVIGPTTERNAKHAAESMLQKNEHNTNI